MSELHDLLASEASRGPSVAAPPFETIVARSRRRRAAQALSVVAVVIAVTAAVVVPSVVGRHRTTEVAALPGGATTEAARIAVTKQEAEELVAGVQLPAGAVASTTAPTQALAQAQNMPGSQNLVVVTRFYTVPGTIEGVLAYAQARPPAGAYADGTSSSSSSDEITSQGIAFSRIATHDYAAPQVWVLATKLGTGVAVRVDAQIVWRPLRTAAEYAPVDANSARACYGGGDCPLSILGPSDARELATYFNSLDTQIPGNRNGCNESATPATFTFDAVTFAVSTCGGVTVTANGVAQPALDITDVAIDPQLGALLGLNRASASLPALSSEVAASSASAVAPAVASDGLSSPTH